jgi:hypothetical protein
MRTANLSGWFLLAVCLGLGGCSTAPSKAVLIEAGRTIIAESPLCVLAPSELDDDVGGYTFVKAQNRAAIDPFLEAGLLRLVDRPEGVAENPSKLWYELTPYGRLWTADCLANQYSYPQRYHWGFRIGSPTIVKTYPLSLLTQHECFTSASVMVEYRMKLEPWFVPGRFKTNFAAGGAVHYYDAIQNVGRTHIPFLKGRRGWVQGEIRLGPHSNFFCEKIERSS